MKEISIKPVIRRLDSLADEPIVIYVAREKSRTVADIDRGSFLGFDFALTIDCGRESPKDRNARSSQERRGRNNQIKAKAKRQAQRAPKHLARGPRR